MRYVKTVGVWPVGLVGGVKVERPKVDSNGKVTGWLTVWSPNRPFAIDMAGFAVNLKRFLSRPDGKFAFEVEKGHQESEFLRHFVGSLGELEPKAERCTKVREFSFNDSNSLSFKHSSELFFFRFTSGILVRSHRISERRRCYSNLRSLQRMMVVSRYSISICRNFSLSASHGQSQGQL